MDDSLSSKHFENSAKLSSHSTNTERTEKVIEGEPGLAPNQTTPIASLERGTEESLLPVDIGLWPWLQCAGCFCIYTSTWGLVGSFGAFQSYYETVLLSGHSPSKIAWIGSFQSALMLFGSAVVGTLYDRGYFKTLLRVGSVLIVLGLMLMSISSKYWHFILTQGLVVGCGFALVFLPTLAVLTPWFVRHRALAISLASSGTGVGGIVFTILINKLIPIIGFGWTARVLGFVILFFVLVANLVMKQRTKPTQTRKLIDLSAWKDGPYLLLALTSLTGYLGIYIPFYYLQVYATSMHISAGLVPYLLPIMNAGYTIGRVIPGIMADRIGATNILIPFLAASGVLGFVWHAIRDDASLIVFCILFGLLGAPLGSLGPSTVISVTPSLDVLGVWMGMMFVPIGIGLLIGPPISGVLLQDNGWLGLQIFCGCCLIASAVALTCSRCLKMGRVVRVKY